MYWKMAESWPTFIFNFNQILRYSTKVFLVLNFPFNKILSHFVSFMIKIFRFTKILQIVASLTIVTDNMS
jgi:hypothetical protein